MLTTLLLPDVNVLQLDLLTIDEQKITVSLTATQAEAECPICGEHSRGVHSHYDRTVADLPWAGVPVQLRLQVRKFFCRNDGCAQTIESFRLPGVVAPRARRSGVFIELPRGNMGFLPIPH
jgi:transposase